MLTAQRILLKCVWNVGGVYQQQNGRTCSSPASTTSDGKWSGLLCICLWSWHSFRQPVHACLLMYCVTTVKEKKAVQARNRVRSRCSVRVHLYMLGFHVHFPLFSPPQKYMYRSILPHSNVLRKYFMPQRPKSSQRTKGPFTLWDTKGEHDIVFHIAFL